MKYLFSLVILAGAAMVFLLFTQPQLDKIKELQSKQAAVESSLTELRELGMVRDTLLTQYNTLHPADLERLRSIVPSSADSGLLIAELERFSKDNEVTLANIDIMDSGASVSSGGSVRRAGEQNLETSFQTLPISFQVSGSYASFRTFLDRLEKHIRIIDVEQISFQGGEGDSYNFILKAKSYSRELPK